MHRMKYIILMFVTALSFFVVFFRSTAVQYQDIQTKFLSTSYVVELPITANTNPTNTLKQLNKLHNSDKLEFVKPVVDAVTNDTTLYLLTNKYSQFDQTVLGFSKSDSFTTKKVTKSPILLSNLAGKLFVGSLNHIPKYSPLNGTYYVKSNKNYTNNELSEILEKNLNITKIKVSSVHKKNNINAIFNTQLIVVLGMCAIILTLVFLYNFFLSYETMSLKLIFGYTKFQLIIDSFKDMLRGLWVVIIMMLVIPIIFVMIFKTTGYLAMGAVIIQSTGWILAILGLAMLLVSILLIPYQATIVSTRGKKPIRTLYIINWVVKIVLILTILLISHTAVHSANQAITVTRNLNISKKILSGYSSTPNMTAEDVDQNNNELVTQYFQNHTQLFTEFYTQYKLLLFSPTNQTYLRLLANKPVEKNNVFDNLVYVSPEYLNQVPIVDSHGKRVKVPNTRQSGLVLVPWSQRHNIKKIQAQTTEQHQFDVHDAGESFISKTSRQTNTSIVPKLTYQYIKDDQNLLTFYGFLAEIHNPILFVVTKNIVSQPYSVYATNFAGQSDDYFIKNNSKHNIQTTIAKNDLSSEFPQVVPAPEYTTTWFNDAITTASINIAFLAIVILTVIMVSLFAIKSHFIIYQDNIFIKKITGYGFGKIMRHFILTNVLLWLICIIYYAIQKDLLLIKFYAMLGAFDLIIMVIVGGHLIKYIKGGRI